MEAPHTGLRHPSSPATNLNINAACLQAPRRVKKESFLLASGRYDQSAAYARQRGKQDGAEDQSELTLWFMKAELLMLTGSLKIRVVVNTHVKRETDKVKPQHKTPITPTP